MGKKIKLIFAAVFAAAFAAAPLCAQGQTDVLEPETVWFTITDEENPGAYQYMEVSGDGTAMLYMPSRYKSFTGRGSIKPRLVKDFIQEIEASADVDATRAAAGSELFVKGETVRLTASREGEKFTVTAPAREFSSGLQYALDQVRKAVIKMPRWDGVYRLVAAQPLSAQDMTAITRQLRREPRFIHIETAEIEQSQPLMKAILNPYRVVPMRTAADYKDLQAFMKKHHIRVDRGYYYISTSRGRFRYEVMEPNMEIK